MPPTTRLPIRLMFGACVALLLSACASARPPEDEVNRIAELMDLRQGMHVADVGAGNSEFSEALAERVGQQGHVYATEVDEADVEDIAERLADAGYTNATALLGTADDTGLDDDCCDAILLRLVYHHFTDPAEMRAGLRRALRPGAPLVVIDIDLQRHWGELDGVPDRGGHGIPADVLVEEMTADGFRVLHRFDDWPGDPDHFCVVFEAVENDRERGPAPPA